MIQDQFWVVLIEAKQYGFSVLQAIPETLAYMMANPNPEKLLFGLITTGEDYLFIKLNARQYAQSYKFTLLLTTLIPIQLVSGLHLSNPILNQGKS